MRKTLKIFSYLAVSCGVLTLLGFGIYNRSVNTVNNKITDEIPEVQKVLLPKTESNLEPIKNELILNFPESATEDEIKNYIASFNGEIVEKIEKTNSYLIKTTGDITKENLTASNLLTSVEENNQLRALSIALPINDPLYSSQWALSNIRVETAWESMDHEEIPVVAVIDSGVCFDHPDLQGKLIDGWDYVENDAIPQDEYNHGCGVAGIIAANINNSQGIVGISPNARILPIRILDENGLGNYADLASAIIYAADNNAQIINISLGGNVDSELIKNAITYATTNNITVVAAAGNTANSTILYPANYPEVISVGSISNNYDSTTGFYEISGFSSISADIDAWLPGQDILTTSTNGGYQSMEGTSLAAAVLSAQLSTGTTFTTSEVESEKLQLNLVAEERQPLTGYMVEYESEDEAVIPQEAKDTIYDSIANWRKEIPETNKFYITNVDLHDTWATGHVIAEQIIEEDENEFTEDHAHYESDEHLKETFIILLSENTWKFGFDGEADTKNILNLISETDFPQIFKTTKFPLSNSLLLAQASTTYKMPWKYTEKYGLTTGRHQAESWHDEGRSLDFKKVGTVSNDLYVMSDSTVSVCYTGAGQAKVTFTAVGSKEVTKYLHIDRNNISTEILNANNKNIVVKQGTRVGKIYTANNGHGSENSTTCGKQRSSGIHIHLTLPKKPIKIDGYTFGVTNGIGVVVKDPNGNKVSPYTAGLRSTNLSNGAPTPTPSEDPNDLSIDNLNLYYKYPDFGSNLDAGGWSNTNHVRTTGDVNGDGKADLVGFGNSGVIVALSNQYGGHDPIKSWTSEFGYSTNWRTNTHTRMLVDMNNDGKDDIIGFWDDGVYVAYSNYPVSETFTLKSKIYSDFSTATGWTPSKHVRTVININNDDKPDIVGFGNGGVYVALAKTTGGFYPLATWHTDYGYNDGWNPSIHIRTIADINNDGAGDIVGFNSHGVFVSISNRVNGFDPQMKSWQQDYAYNDGWRTELHTRKLADVDGDGAKDIVGFGGPGVLVSQSNMIDGFNPIMEEWHSNFGYADGWNSTSHVRTLDDADGDGKDDLIIFGDEGAYIAKSTAIKFYSSKWHDNFDRVIDGWSTAMHIRGFADVNGDQLMDIIGFGNSGTVVAFANTQDGYNPAVTWDSKYGYNSGWRLDKHHRMFVDMNNDNMSDVVAFGNDGIYVTYSAGIEPGETKKIHSDFSSVKGWNSVIHYRTIANIDGLYGPDIVGFNSGGVIVSLSNASGGYDSVKDWSKDYGYNDGWTSEKHVRAVIDMNHDGKADIVGFKDDGVYVTFSTTTGAGETKKVYSDYATANGWDNIKYVRTIADVNGDGNNDIIGFGPSVTYVSFSDINGDFGPIKTFHSNFGNADGWRNDLYVRNVFDVDFDGKADLVGFGEDGVYGYLSL